jgi:hypothetical protein
MNRLHPVKSRLTGMRWRHLVDEVDDRHCPYESEVRNRVSDSVSCRVRPESINLGDRFADRIDCLCFKIFETHRNPQKWHGSSGFHPGILERQSIESDRHSKSSSINLSVQYRGRQCDELVSACGPSARSHQPLSDQGGESRNVKNAQNLPWS